MRLEHFVPAQTGHQTHYLYRHLSSSFYANASVACSSSSSDSGKSAGATKPVPDIKTQHVQSAAQRVACIVNGVRDQSDRICVCVCSCLFPNIFGDTSLHSPEWVLTPSLAFQKDLACFCCLLCWHHFSEISKKQLTSYCCMCFEENGVLHIASRTCLELSSTNQHHVHCL